MRAKTMFASAFRHLFNYRLLAVPFVVYTIADAQKHHCFWPFSSPSKLSPNKINNRISSIQYPANDPNEDTVYFQQLTSIDGYIAAMFDGHSGVEIAEYLKEHIGKQLDKVLANNKGTYLDTDELIRHSLKQVLMQAQEYFLNQLAVEPKQSQLQKAKQGSTALIVLVANNRIYTANLGDSQAYLINQPEQDEWVVTRLNEQHSANSVRQKEDLKKLFPKDQDLIKCFKKDQNCFVKGVLQPTRTIGDFFLKRSEYRPESFKPFTQPYISSEPQITSHEITPQSKYIIMGTDGLWNEVDQKDLVSVVSSPSKDVEVIDQVFHEVVQNIARDIKKPEQEIRTVPVGARRKIHDDISIVVIDLASQVSSS